jgi:ABC-type sugar transport system substrate-binding protein
LRIDLICCLDATATLGVAQSIVELNKVNVITIIGSGKTNEVLNMIRKGIVTATVAVDYEKIGTETINILARYTKKPLSYKKHILSDIYVIDKSNVRSYMEVTAE